ncbi:uncharacterized protein J4E84_008051 [Alternaria hordeiaustralica]|uniref:uncharacterized protein n=1 Tax=Alternaria hordeiaustralica TaxID=1187925 RepID=UPI0020C2B035|nr:uncharacterized protein J4E84_008051 [Alternaria hordeiaustralica]KAI4680403.1 hypothetical protein J4E84_008051 [Alternaria hordeiaustralica]
MHFPLPNPILHGQIAQVYSQTSNPTATSLLTIPAELRNQIYEYLLVEDEPILIAGSSQDDTAIKTGSFSGSPAILQTCRQIYHEAIGVLYGHNIFQFNYGIVLDEGTILFPTKAYLEWTQEIGSSLSALRTVIIDTDAPHLSNAYDHLPFWEDFYRWSRSDIDILPFLDVFWNGVARDLSVRFESSGRRIHPDSDEYPDPDELGPDPKHFTKVLYELGRLDTLKLKNARRLLRDIKVAPNGKQGTIRFLSTSRKADVTQRFQLSEKTQGYELVPSRPNLLNLPNDVVRTIARFASTNREITYNFNTGVTNGLNLSMLHVNVQVRTIVSSDFHCKSDFIIFLSSNTLRSSSAMFERLDRRVVQHYGQKQGRLRSCTPIEASQRYKIAPSIVLQFQTDELLHLATVRIDARDLLRVTSVFPPGTTIIVRVCGRDETRDHITTLGEIRKYVLVLMEHSLMISPRIPLRVRDPMVEIELNHHCLPVRVTYWQNISLPNGVRVREKTMNMVDVASLHELVRERWWVPDSHMNGFMSHEVPEGWDDETRYSLIKCLKNLCSWVEEREDEVKEEMDTVERGAIRDEKDAQLRDGQAGDVEKAGINGVAGDGEDLMGNNPSTQKELPPLKGLSFLDRFLVVWIILAMGIGIALGNTVDSVGPALQRGEFVGVSIPIAIGLLVMMYPILCKVRFETLHLLLKKRDLWIQIAVSFVLNWIIAPLFMVGLAWAFLPDRQDLREGLIFVGIARCIAMVLIWTDLAGGDGDYCAVLVAFNSILQIVLFAPFAVFYIQVVSHGNKTDISYEKVAQSVGVFLGIPLGAAVITRLALRSMLGEDRYQRKFIRYIAPFSLIGLIYTIIVLFASQGAHVVRQITDVLRVCAPLLVYFIVIFTSTVWFCWKMGFSYKVSCTQSFTAASNNFELAIAVVVAVYGAGSGQALASTVGPLIEVPVLVLLVYVLKWIRKRWQWV